MKWLGSVVALAWLSATGFGQETAAGPSSTVPLVPAQQPGYVVPLDSSAPILFPDDGAADSPRGRFTSNRNFSNFIGFLSNPLQNIDPRSLTQIWPIFGSAWVNPIPVLPSGNLQVYGAGLNVALSDRLSFGLNQGGYAMADFNGNQPGLFRGRIGLLRSRRGFAGQRDGWLNLGGFAQYTLIPDVPNQFLLTAGLRLELPSGSSAVFQGFGPVHLAPYLTFGKEFGKFHVLGTGASVPDRLGRRHDLPVLRQRAPGPADVRLVLPAGRVQLDLPHPQRGCRSADAPRLHRLREFLVVGEHPDAGGGGQRDFNGLLVKMLMRY